MKRFTGCLLMIASMCILAESAAADDKSKNGAIAVTTPDAAVQVTLIRWRGQEQVQSVSGGSTEGSTCSWASVPAESSGLGDVVQASAGPAPSDQAVAYNLFCNGVYRTTVWVGPEDIVDVDAAIQAEAERYVQDVLAPVVRIGVNPSGQGLVGLASWFWIEGFSGSVQAPPISAFGMTVDVRMSSGTVTWDFDDGTVEQGDLGRAYPEESTVQHRFQRHGTYDVTAAIELLPEYSVNGGPWLTLPNLSVTAAASHTVEQRQPVLTNR